MITHHRLITALLGFVALNASAADAETRITCDSVVAVLRVSDLRDRGTSTALKNDAKQHNAWSLNIGVTQNARGLAQVI